VSPPSEASQKRRGQRSVRKYGKDLSISDEFVGELAFCPNAMGNRNLSRLKIRGIPFSELPRSRINVLAG
jgi:hypothetical protein